MELAHSKKTIAKRHGNTQLRSIELTVVQNFIKFDIQGWCHVKCVVDGYQESAKAAETAVLLIQSTTYLPGARNNRSFTPNICTTFAQTKDAPLSPSQTTFAMYTKKNGRDIQIQDVKSLHVRTHTT